MSKTLYLKLNNLDYSDNHIAALYDYLSTGSYPEAFEYHQRYKMKRNYTDFKIIDGKIFYIPLNLEVIKESEQNELLQRLYNDDKIGIGSGIQSFYNKVASKYLGFSRKQIKEFLDLQEPYQLSKTKPKVINSPVIALYPNHRWALDLIDMTLYKSSNNNHKWILTVIDFFSRFVFAIGLLNKEGPTVLNGLESIITNQAQNTYPVIIQADNGKEFDNDALKKWSIAHKVKIVHSLSYTPQSNGLIENFNGILRKMIREGFIRTQTLNWIDHLSDYLINRNNSKQTTIKNLPINIWRAGVDKMDELTEEIKKNLHNKITKDKTDLMYKSLINIQNKVKKDINKEATQTFKKGDEVRALNSSLYSKIRAKIKAGQGKLVVVKYSPEIFTVKTLKKQPPDTLF